MVRRYTVAVTQTSSWIAIALVSCWVGCHDAPAQQAAAARHTGRGRIEALGKNTVLIHHERLEGIDLSAKPRRGSRSSGRSKAPAKAEAEAVAPNDTVVEPVVSPATEERDFDVLVTQTLSGLERSTSGPVLASMLKRTILRKDPTFNESNYGFRGFGELIRHLADRGVVELADSSAAGDPEVRFPAQAHDEDAAFELLRSTVERQAAKGPVYLSGLKSQLRKREPDFSEKKFGYGGFLQFCKAARTRGLIEMELDDTATDSVVRLAA